MNDPANRKTSRPAQAASPPQASKAGSKAGIIPWPPIVYLAGIVVSLILNALYVLPWFGSPMADILLPVGWLALLAFAALFATSVRTLAKAKTPVNPNAQPEHLVTKGPFSVSRNPIYLGNTLLLIGIGLVTGITWFLPAAVLCAFITQKIAIEREERWLADKFGKPYRDYAKRVRRWI